MDGFDIFTTKEYRQVLEFIDIADTTKYIVKNIMDGDKLVAMTLKPFPSRATMIYHGEHVPENAGRIYSYLAMI